MGIDIESLKKASKILEQHIETKDDRYLVYTLNDFVRICEEKNIESANIEMLQEYRCSILWHGRDDVEYALNSSYSDDELRDVPNKWYYALLDEVTEMIDWSEVETASVAAGNEIIVEKINDYITKHPMIGLGG